MRRVHLQLPVYLPDGVYRRLRGMRDSLRGGHCTIDLWGDRDVEYSFIAAELPPGPGMALDFGCGPGQLALVAAQRGYQVLAIDLEPQRFPWNHPRVEFRQADFLQAHAPSGEFDVVINCSAIEHVGLSGRYGITREQEDGDLAAIHRLHAALKPGGVMLLTVPCGRDAVFAPLHRVYGTERLPRLIERFELVKQVFWVKSRENRWRLAERDEALDFVATADLENPARCTYALGCFVLCRPQGMASASGNGS